MALVAGIDRQQAAPPRSGIERLVDLASQDLEAVNAIILEHMKSEVDLIPQLAGHIIAAGGKRLRPMLTLASARLCNYRGRRHLALAACVEFIHTATLLHDDVVDESDLRRGLATANALWGNVMVAAPSSATHPPTALRISDRSTPALRDRAG